MCQSDMEALGNQNAQEWGPLVVFILSLTARSCEPFPIAALGETVFFALVSFVGSVVL